MINYVIGPEGSKFSPAVSKDIVAAEARYHVLCRTNFENPLPKFETNGRPTSTQKLILFEKACESLEDDIELHTVAEFHNLMSKRHLLSKNDAIKRQIQRQYTPRNKRR